MGITPQVLCVLRAFKLILLHVCESQEITKYAAQVVMLIIDIAL